MGDDNCRITQAGLSTRLALYPVVFRVSLENDTSLEGKFRMGR